MIFSRTIFHVEWPWQKLLGWTQQRHSIKKKEEKQPIINDNKTDDKGFLFYLLIYSAQ